MANRAYLCGSNLATVHPSHVEATFAPESQTIATSSYEYPIGWHLLFTSRDIVDEVFSVHEDEIPVWAPLATKQRCVQNLDHSCSFLASLFPDSRLDEYFVALRETVLSFPYDYLTIELSEIDYLYPDNWFRDAFTQIADALHGHTSNVDISLPPSDGYNSLAGAFSIKRYHSKSLAELLCKLANLDPQIIFPNLDLIRTYAEIPAAMKRAGWAVLGSRHITPTSWDPS